MEYQKFPCGCSFPIRERPNGYKQPLVNFSINDIKDCPAVWDLFSKALVGGIFQCESSHGMRWSKELKPTCLEDLSALASILRPGCLQSFCGNGSSVTKEFCDRKNGKSPVEYPIKALEPILKATYGLSIYQESSIRIGIEIAGFSLSEADTYLRKAIGKKNAELLFSIEEKFVAGCEKIGKVTKEEAKIIFDNIKASARYNFNASHSFGYAVRSYAEAFLKTHFPLCFYTSKLKSPRGNKTHEDINDLIYEAKLFNIETKLPDLRDMRPEFYHDGEIIRPGLIDIKRFGSSNFNDLVQVIEKTGPAFWENFFEFCIHSSRYLTESVVKLLIGAGAVDFFGMTRSQMLEEYDLMGNLTKGEKTQLFRHYDAVKCGVPLAGTPQTPESFGDK